MQKKALAAHMTELVHGKSGLQKAQAATEIFFGKEVTDAESEALQSIVADVPNAEVQRSALEGDGVNVIDAFVESPLAKSRGEIRRTLEQGGAYVNNVRVTNVDHQITTKDLIGGKMILLRSGKKKYAILNVVG